MNYYFKKSYHSSDYTLHKSIFNLAKNIHIHNINDIMVIKDYIDNTTLKEDLYLCPLADIEISDHRNRIYHKLSQTRHLLYNKLDNNNHFEKNNKDHSKQNNKDDRNKIRQYITNIINKNNNLFTDDDNEFVNSISVV